MTELRCSYCGQELEMIGDIHGKPSLCAIHLKMINQALLEALEEISRPFDNLRWHERRKMAKAAIQKAKGTDEEK